MTTRRVPRSVTASWDRLAADPPLSALEASHALHRALAQWQTDLVREAVASGASWEEIGVALGTTKQGAWARFRIPLGERGGHVAMDSASRREARKRIHEAWEAGQRRLREMESKWRDEQQRLRTQLEESRDRLTEAKRRHTRERRDARQALRREMEVVRADSSGGQ